MVQRCCPIEPRIPEHDGERTRRLAALARALADETRLALLTVLLRHEAPLCVCHLVERLAVGQPTVSHHLQRLRRAGLVTVERRGTWAYYQATDLARAALAGLEQALFQR
ncbi:MAG: metalloregulator ArsR/SmtB family transcription factor, partial [Thermomicrobium sp.]|nr:metalloregulator ArsR/SmtB family transcription factor [Thermomicrobium sp.]